MELKTNYQYTYFIYPFAINERGYLKYIANLMKNKKYQIKFFDYFKDVELYKYFVPSVKETIFQDFSFNTEKINQFEKLSFHQKMKILQKENCLIFEYILDQQLQGKTEEKDGIFFTISKIELICFKTGICFLLLKTHLVDTDQFSDILNFNCKFDNINLENKNIKKLKNIKIQTDRFNNMSEISEILENITGQKLESKRLDIDPNMFLVYTYVCIDSTCWNQDKDFEEIQNEFIKLAEVKPSDVNINVDYDKLSLFTDASYRKIRIGSKCVAAICSSTDTENYTKLPETYEKQYLYTYIIALHQRYYLKKLNKDFEIMPHKVIKKFIEFVSNNWISEITSDSLGQKLYKRYKEKLNLEELFHEAKSKYDLFYKKQKIEKNQTFNQMILLILIICFILGAANLASWLFFK